MRGDLRDLYIIRRWGLRAGWVMVATGLLCSEYGFVRRKVSSSCFMSVGS